MSTNNNIHSVNTFVWFPNSFKMKEKHLYNIGVFFVQTKVRYKSNTTHEKSVFPVGIH